MRVDRFLSVANGLLALVAFIAVAVAPAGGSDVTVGELKQEESLLRVPVTITVDRQTAKPLLIDSQQVRLQLRNKRSVPAAGFVVPDPISGPRPSGGVSVDGMFTVPVGAPFLDGTFVTLNQAKGRMRDHYEAITSGRFRVTRNVVLPLAAMQSPMLLSVVEGGGIELESSKVTALAGSVLEASFTRFVGWNPIRLDGDRYRIEVLFEAELKDVESIVVGNTPARKIRK